MREFIGLALMFLVLAAAGAETGHAGNKGICRGTDIPSLSSEC